MVGSFSALAGLLIWPAGLVLLYLRRRAGTQLLTWLGCAAITGAVYFFHFGSGTSSTFSYVLVHPVQALKYFCFVLGAVVGVQFSNLAVISLGAAIGALAGWILIVGILRRDNTGGSPIGMTLICFGLLFAASVTGGRSGLGLWAPSRYTTFTLLVPVGCYLTLLDRRRTLMGARHRIERSVLPVLVAAILCLQVAVGTAEGWAAAKTWHHDQLAGADVMVNIDKATDTLVSSQLVSPSYSPRALDRLARIHRLSLFGTSAASQYSNVGLFAGFLDIRSSVVRPSKGAELSGTELLVATATDLSGVSGVRFELTGGPVHGTVIGTGRPSFSGWLSHWDTTSVSNGTYTLRSVAYADGPQVGVSAGEIGRAHV